jgi:hypothetical protein
MPLNRKNLIALAAFITLVGIALASVPFLNPSNPVDHLPGHTTALDASGVLPGSSKLFRLNHSMKRERKDGSTAGYHGAALLLVKDKDAKVYLYYLPMWEGEVMMPDKHWWQHEGYCQELVTDFMAGKDPVIHCKSSDRAEFLTKQWKWSIDGKNLGSNLPDLIAVGYKQQEDIIEAFYR